jgi:hypothetical protein
LTLIGLHRKVDVVAPKAQKWRSLSSLHLVMWLWQPLPFPDQLPYYRAKGGYVFGEGEDKVNEVEG